MRLNSIKVCGCEKNAPLSACSYHETKSRAAGQTLNPVEQGAQRPRRIGEGLDDPRPAEIHARGRAGDVGAENPRRVRDQDGGQAGLGDQRAHLIGADLPHRRVGRGVVAVRDHRLQHHARRRRPGEVDEYRAAGRADAVVDRQLLLLGQLSRLDRTQILGQHKGLEGAGGEQEQVRPIGEPAGCPAIADMHQVALPPRQPQKPGASSVEITAARRAVGSAGGCDGDVRAGH
jgi:hypothetical protein